MLNFALKKDFKVIRHERVVQFTGNNLKVSVEARVRHFGRGIQENAGGMLGYN